MGKRVWHLHGPAVWDGREERRGRGRGGGRAIEPMEVSEGTTSSEEEDVDMDGGDEWQTEQREDKIGRLRKFC